MNKRDSTRALLYKGDTARLDALASKGYRNRVNMARMIIDHCRINRVMPLLKPEKSEYDNGSGLLIPADELEYVYSVTIEGNFTQAFRGLIHAYLESNK